jgi:membrane protein
MTNAADGTVPKRRVVWTAFLAPVRWYLGQVIQQFRIHDCLAAAGTLTYTTLFAIVPTMTVTVVVLSLIPEFASIGEQIQTYIFRNFVPGSGDVVYEKLAEFSANTRNLTWLSFAFLVVTAFMMLVTMESTFNRIWQVPQARRGVHRILTYWTVLTLTPMLIVGGVLISVYVRALPILLEINDFGLGSMLLAELPKLLSVAIFTMLYYAVPNYDVPLKHAFIGGVITTIGFQFTMWIFANLLPTLSFSVIYGAFAAIPVFLIWIYIVWVLVLSGVVIVRTLSLDREREPTPEPLIVKAARLLKLLKERHDLGEGASASELAAVVRLNTKEHERIYSALNELKLIQTGADERWFLGRSLTSLSLWDLYHAFPEGIDLERLRAVEDLPGVVEPIRAIVQFGSNEMSIDLAAALASQSARR